MKITTTVEIKELDYPNKAQDPFGALEIRVFIDGEPTGSVRALSGPISDIKLFAAGEIDLAEVRRRWGMSKP